MIRRFALLRSFVGDLAPRAALWHDLGDMLRPRLALALLGACLAFAADAGAGPKAEKPEPASQGRKLAASSVSPMNWSYPLPVDHGIRRDPGGSGYFMAPRRHGAHNGLDLLAPVGTPILAACDGLAKSGTGAAFGHWVQLVCPLKTADGTVYYASLFHAHMQRKVVPKRTWGPVRHGSHLGTVGKTGNAVGTRIMPHVHFELIVHPTQQAALAEHHYGRNQRNNAAADRFFATLRRDCLSQSELRSPTATRRARRFDPYAVLHCLAVEKPGYTVPNSESLKAASLRWSEHYDR